METQNVLAYDELKKNYNIETKNSRKIKTQKQKNPDKTKPTMPISLCCHSRTPTHQALENRAQSFHPAQPQPYNTIQPPRTTPTSSRNQNP